MALENGPTWRVRQQSRDVRFIWADSLAYASKKGSELPDGDKRKKYKYRVVFGGNNILDQTWEQAVFQSLGSSPATMSAGKFLDYYICVNGNSGEQADAEHAYIQAELK